MTLLTYDFITVEPAIQLTLSLLYKPYTIINLCFPNPTLYGV